MSTEAEIYDFQGAIEPALAATFEAAGYAVYLLTSDKAFQKRRPRLEIELLVGASRGTLQALAGTRGIAGENRVTSFEAQTKINVVTSADITVHRTYLAKIRNFTATMLARVNGGRLTRHALMMFKPAGESNIWKPEDGVYATAMMFDSPFSIQKDSLAELE